MWLVQYRSKWGVSWFTIFNQDKGYHKNVAQLIMERTQKQFPRYEFRLLEKE